MQYMKQIYEIGPSLIRLITRVLFIQCRQHAFATRSNVVCQQPVDCMSSRMVKKYINTRKGPIFCRDVLKHIRRFKGTCHLKSDVLLVRKIRHIRINWMEEVEADPSTDSCSVHKNQKHKKIIRFTAFMYPHKSIF